MLGICSLSSEFPLRLCLCVYIFALFGFSVLKVNFPMIKADICVF